MLLQSFVFSLPSFFKIKHLSGCRFSVKSETDEVEIEKKVIEYWTDYSNKFIKCYIRWMFYPYAWYSLLIDAKCISNSEAQHLYNTDKKLHIYIIT